MESIQFDRASCILFIVLLALFNFGREGASFTVLEDTNGSTTLSKKYPSLTGGPTPSPSLPPRPPKPPPAYPVKWAATIRPPSTSLASNTTDAVRRPLKVQHGILFLKRSLYVGAVFPAGTKLTSSGTSGPSWRFVIENDNVPFDHEHLNTILAKFSIARGSEEAEQVADTLRTCLIGGDQKDESYTCVTSWQAMVEFAKASLETRKPRAVMTMLHGRKEPSRYVVATNGVAEIGGPVMPCHPMPYPYEVYFCHRPKDARAFRVELVSKDTGTAVHTTAFAVCHMNTSEWDGRYFDMLRARLGEAICHFIPQPYLLWLGSPA